MLHDKHLRIGERDVLADWLSKALGSAKSGTIKINFSDEPAVEITANNGKVAVNLLQPSIFRIPEDETGLFDKLKTASEFGRKLSDNDVTLSILRKNKEVVILGKGARPTLSKLVTRSDDLQMSSVREFSKLKGDLKSD
jgi:hypothetical protein